MEKQTETGQNELINQDAAEKEGNQGKRHRNKIRKTAAIAGTAVISLLLLMYLGTAFYFSSHYFYQTRINGEDCGMLTEEQARHKIDSRIASYEIEIIGKDKKSDKLTASDIGLSLVYDSSFDRIRESQNPLLWFTALFKGYDFELTNAAKFDETEFEEAVQGLVFFKDGGHRKPRNAYIGEYDEETGQYAVVEGEQGTALDGGKFREVLREAVSGLKERIYLDMEDCYEQPEIAADDPRLLKALATANKYVSARIVYDWNGAREVVDGSMIREWITIEELKVTLDEEQAAAYVSSKAKEHDTYGRDRTFVTTDGRTMELKSGGYGWKTDREAETAALLEAVKKGAQTEKEPAYSRTAAQKGRNDIGNSYVEIDMGLQHLYLYVDGAIVLESDFVSGNLTRGWGTPAGVFGLTYKTRNAVLRGENYETPVSYWMPFNGNIGMHDATWRSEFGGDIYVNGGSHGCINLPFDMAAKIYEYVSTGFPVVCYY